MTKPNQIKLLPHETINELNKTGDYADNYPYATNTMETAFLLLTLTDSYRKASSTEGSNEPGYVHSGGRVLSHLRA